MPQRGGEGSLFLPPSLSAHGLSGLGDPHPHWAGQAAFFTQSTRASANFFQKWPHRHTQKECLTTYLGILWPSQVNTQY